jgi:hypothetical protein
MTCQQIIETCLAEAIGAGGTAAAIAHTAL